MPESVYIHIPFCKSKCKYCAFVSFANENNESILTYIYSLLKEINDNYNGEKLKTLYIGGGTPSIIPTEMLKKIVDKFNLDDNTEVTIELNPDDIDEDYLKRLKSIKFNRLSFGAQTFNNRILKLIGRRHNAEKIKTAVLLAKKCNFENISIDLIYGLPEQTIEDVKKDLEIFLSLDIPHLSTYGLKIEENSYFGIHKPNSLPDDDIQAEMYEVIAKFLTKNDYKHYEISNYAKEGYESKHNNNYWENREYYGFGVAAHGYVNGIRYSNYCELAKYIDSPSNHEYGKFLTQQEKLEEEIFLGFRLAKGINIEKINQNYNIDFNDKYKNILERYSEYLIKTGNGYSFNLQGMLLSNEILSEFIE